VTTSLILSHNHVIDQYKKCIVHIAPCAVCLELGINSGARTSKQAALSFPVTNIR